jgi:hypothetical protein
MQQPADLRIANGSQRRQVRAIAQLPQAADLVDETITDHLAAAMVNATM